MKHWPVLLCASFLLAACQSAPSENAIQTAIAQTAAAATDTPRPSATQQPTATPTTTPTTTATATPTPQPIMLTEEEMAGLMLTVDDLYSGYTALPENTGPITYDYMANLRGAELADAMKSGEEIRGFNAGFERSGLIEAAFLRSWVVEFTSHSAATEFIDTYDTLSNVDLQPMSFTKFGEQSAAYRGQRLNESGEAVADVTEILIRQRNLVVGLTMTTRAGFADVGEIEDYVSTLANRLEQLVAEQ